MADKELENEKIDPGKIFIGHFWNYSMFELQYSSSSC